MMQLAVLPVALQQPCSQDPAPVAARPTAGHHYSTECTEPMARLCQLCCCPCSHSCSSDASTTALVLFHLDSAPCAGAVAKAHSSQHITHLFISIAFLLFLLPVQFPLCFLPCCCRQIVVQPAQVMQGEDALKRLPDPHQSQQLGPGQSINQHCAQGLGQGTSSVMLPVWVQVSGF